MNVGGLAVKLASNDFIDYLNAFDLICLTKTFVDKEFENQKDSMVFVQGV